ncbi:hypothetical protein ACFW5W_02705 [Streptomyces sp. NPDC058783]|uniref:hypothetical protein n=1 Tax=Streptomyces sp. NPDC058783 TaxID=3346633 RepID=UPI0036BC74A8
MSTSSITHHASRITSTRAPPRSAVTPPSTEGRSMAQKIEIRPLDKKETTGDSNSQGA